MQIKEKKSSPPTIYFNIWQTKYIFDLHPYRKLRIFAKNKQHHDKKTINCFHIIKVISTELGFLTNFSLIRRLIPL